MANKKRLIDANALVEKYWQMIMDGYVTAKDVRYAIENAPTVDAVEVVRCKDCKFYEPKHYPDGKQRMCCENNKAIWAATPPDAFCSYGERRTDG